MLPSQDLLKKTGFDTLVIALANTPEKWPLRAEAAGIFTAACEIAARLSAYDDMLRAAANMSVLAAELQSPVLLAQAKEIYERFQTEVEIRPLFKSIPTEEVN